MILYVNGDSHSLGVMKHGGTGKSFVDAVAEQFNLTVVNHAEASASASNIVRKTKEFFSTNNLSDITVLIGWGSWEREEWEYNGEFYNVMRGWYKHLPKELQAQYKIWEESLTPDSIDKKSKIAHKEIYELHRFLQQLNIPHLFFNCMYNFFGITKDNELDWNNCYIGPYDTKLSYYWYLINQGHSCDHWYHFDNSAHKVWGEFLIEYIKKNKIL